MKTLATILDEKAVGLGREYLNKEAEILCLLMEMRKKRLFSVLNYTGIFDYCERRLKFSRAQAFYFKSVAEKSEEVPEIKRAVVQGEITLSQARRIVPAVTKSNSEEWIEKAKKLSQLELEREVKSVNPKAHVRERISPVAKTLSELRVGVDVETERDIRTLTDVLSQKLGKPASLSQVIAWMAREMRERHDPVEKARRAISLRRSSASVKHPVIVRDSGQCAYVSPDGRRCLEKRWLDLHHVTPKSQGGADTPENLRVLCKGHHQLTHARHPSPRGHDFQQPIFGNGKTQSPSSAAP